MEVWLAAWWTYTEEGLIMLDMSQIPGMKMGYCQDKFCEEERTLTPVTYLRYIDSNKTSAWVCELCLESWSDALEDYCANMVDLDLPEAYPMIP
jgi:hypothetical protein